MTLNAAQPPPSKSKVLVPFACTAVVKEGGTAGRWSSLSLKGGPCRGPWRGKPGCLHSNLLCQPTVRATALAGPGPVSLGREVEAFAICSCLLYLETQASQSHKLP